MTDDLRRSRVLVFFRLPIALPHIVWRLGWTLLALVTAILMWLCALVTGRLPRPFHRFYRRYIRYSTHLTAFIALVGNPFPGFVGKRGSYPIDLELPAEPEPQKRARHPLPAAARDPGALISARCSPGRCGRRASSPGSSPSSSGGCRTGSATSALRPPLQRADERLRVPADAALSVRRPTGRSDLAVVGTRFFRE